MYTYKAKLDRVVDGDTVDANIDLGFDIFMRDRIRLMGIDTPESRTRRKAEKVLGLAAKARLKELLKGQKVSIQCTKEKGKFGRILADVVVNDKSINQQLIEEGHARKYMGGKKEPWIINE